MDDPTTVVWPADRDDLASHHLERIGPVRSLAEREAAIVTTLQEARPGIVVLTESWA